MSAISFFGVNEFDLDFGVQIDSVEQPIKSNSVGSGNMSHREISALNDHVDLCFVDFKNVQLKLPWEEYISVSLLFGLDL